MASNTSLVSCWNGPIGICTTLYRTQTFSIVLKRTNGNLYDPVSYSNFQYHTETDQWEFLRPCIILKFLVSYWHGTIGICTILYRTKPFSTILKDLGSYTYAPKGLNYFYAWYSMLLKIQFVRPCMVLNVLVRYWKFEYGTESFSTIQGRTITTLMVRHSYLPYCSTFVHVDKLVSRYLIWHFSENCK